MTLMPCPPFRISSGQILSPQQPLEMLAEEGGDAEGGGGGGEAVLRSDDPTWQLVSEIMAAAFLSSLCVASTALFSLCPLQLRNKLKAAVIANMQQQQQQQQQQQFS